MHKTNWEENGRKYTATVNGLRIGRITITLAKTDRPVLACSENGQARYFSLLIHAKQWIEDLYADIAE